MAHLLSFSLSPAPLQVTYASHLHFFSLFNSLQPPVPRFPLTDLLVNDACVAKPNSTGTGFSAVTLTSTTPNQVFYLSLWPLLNSLLGRFILLRLPICVTKGSILVSLLVSDLLKASRSQARLHISTIRGDSKSPMPKLDSRSTLP